MIAWYSWCCSAFEGISTGNSVICDYDNSHDNSSDHSSDDDSSDDDGSDDNSSDDDSSDDVSSDDDDDVMHWRCYSEFVATAAEFLFWLCYSASAGYNNFE